MFTGVLTEKQWSNVENLQQQMQKEYKIRREMLLKRLDVTIQSFKVSVMNFITIYMGRLCSFQSYISNGDSLFITEIPCEF